MDGNRPRRTKKVIKEMFPIKKWLTLEQGAAFMDMHENTLMKLAMDEKLTLSIIGAKKYVKVSELEEMIEESVFRR